MENFWENTTCMPHNDPAKIDRLLQTVCEKREIDLIAFSLKMISSQPALCQETGFFEGFNILKSASAERRRELIKHPLFVAWFKQTVRAQNEPKRLAEKLTEFGRVWETTARDDEALLTVEGQRVLIRRYEVDPLIMEAAFPEYQLPDRDRRNEIAREVIYPERLFAEMLAIALERIKHSWPEAYRNFPRFVKIVVDMIDGEYTSYSSAEHTGAIFVSTDNSPLVALEEFLIHEFGHQILYYLMEVDPLITEGDETIYRLPWSGNERDLYGYFHAFYIYILMARYLERVKHRSKREQKRIKARRSHILKGLKQTVEAFEKNENFTDCGRVLFNNLKSEVEQIEENIRNK
ncbi:MAG: HEXXH motif-containing putative peptide modification protein [Pyrinomonadaceae bacterium]